MSDHVCGGGSDVDARENNIWHCLDDRYNHNLDFIPHNMMMDMEEASSIEDVKKEDYSDPAAGQIVSFVNEKFSKAETARELDEQRWIQAYRNYRGIYGPDVQFTSTEKSQVFVKVTKTKVLAAYGQIAEVLFGGNKFPITIDPSVLPDGVEDTVNFETNPDQRKAEEGMPDLLPG